MNTETFINQNCHLAPHLNREVADFMINAGVEAVLQELSTPVPGWECDLYSWLVVGDNDETFVVETNHGGAFRTSVSLALDRLHKYQATYNNAINILTTELQQKAHVIT